MRNIIVTGGASGLGALIAQHLGGSGHNVFVWDRNADPLLDVREPSLATANREWPASRAVGTVDCLINCAGINRIAWLEDVDGALWDETISTNAEGILRMTQACLPALKRNRGTVLNIVSNAAHMPMRCSAAYNASKAAALMLTKQMARELAPDVTVFSVSPNRLAGTGMSEDIDQQVCATRGWSVEEARKYQLASLQAGEETDPETLAEFIAFLLSSKKRHMYLTGCDIPYGL